MDDLLAEMQSDLFKEHKRTKVEKVIKGLWVKMRYGQINFENSPIFVEIFSKMDFGNREFFHLPAYNGYCVC